MRNYTPWQFSFLSEAGYESEEVKEMRCGRRCKTEEVSQRRQGRRKEEDEGRTEIFGKMENALKLFRNRLGHVIPVNE